MSFFKRFLLLGSIGVVLLAGLMLTSSIKASSTTFASGCNTVAINSWSNNCTVSDGNISNFVAAIQNTIYETHACGTLLVDGDFGPATLAAVKCFQGKHSLAQDGTVGPLTWGALYATLKYDYTASGWAYYYVDNGIGDDYRKSTSSGEWYLFRNISGGSWCPINLSSPC
jgi:peptidoglycan hydrolase-like protein with peptidoglycan-binding domain